MDRPGGVFPRRRDLLSAEVLRMLRATARVHLACDGRSLTLLTQGAAPEEEAQQLDLAPAPTRLSGAVAPSILTQIRVRAVRSAKSLLDTAASVVLGGDAGTPAAEPRARRPRCHAQRRPLAGSFGNGYGSPTADGDYEIVIDGERLPPAPWST